MKQKEVPFLMLEYEYALNYVLWNRFDDLFTIMLRTQDHFLQKKIENLLYAYYYPHLSYHTEDAKDALLQYLEHAMLTCHVNV